MSEAALPLILIEDLHKSFGSAIALKNVNASIEAGTLTGLVGPDGAGKTTLMRLLAALMNPTSGRILVLGHDLARQGKTIHHSIGYMPQRFGLYEDLTVAQNLSLYADLRGIDQQTREQTLSRMYAFTRLGPFQDRIAGRLSGGMKQKLGLACAMVGSPKVLLLDEPSVGVDPLSRQDLWAMVRELTEDGMAVVWSTAYLEEAERCAALLLLDKGRLLHAGKPSELTDRLLGRSHRLMNLAGDKRDRIKAVLEDAQVRDAVIQGDGIRVVCASQAHANALATRHDCQVEPVAPRFEDAFIDLFGEGIGNRSTIAERMPKVKTAREVMVECKHLTRRFGAFTATNDVSFAVQTGEVFGLLGPNGAGKSTTFRMLCGLLRPSTGDAHVAGYDLATSGAAAKSQLGYMAQKFSLYGLLSVKQNLDFFSGTYGLRGKLRRQRIDEMIETFELANVLGSSPETLPLGYRQRLALACALMHRPAVLFLDEPTSGVDPMTRREFWMHVSGLVSKRVTVLVTTHFMDEAEYCDRIGLIDKGRLVEIGAPDALKRLAATDDCPEPTMEQAFIALIHSRQRSVP